MEWIRDYDKREQRVRGTCGPCAGVLDWCVHGWRLPRENARSFFSSEIEARNERWSYLEKRRGLDRVEGLTLEDGIEAWREAGVSERQLARLFPEEEGPGRPRLHRWLDPDTVRVTRLYLSDLLHHLEETPTDALADHFDEAFGESWPPYLEEVHDVLREAWARADAHPIPGQRKRSRRSTALRVAARLPLGVDVVRDAQGRVESATYRDNPFSYRQLHDLDKRAPEEPSEGVTVTTSGPWPEPVVTPEEEES